MTSDADMAAPTCGPDGCTINPTTSSTTAAAGMPQRGQGPILDLQVVSDAICPWCYVAKQHLKVALARLADEGLYFNVHWMPFELNPEMPKGGMERREYRSRKFGSWQKSRSLDGGVTAAGRAAGLEFHHELMQRTPNTFDSHRLVWLAGREGVQDAVVEAVFRAYFSEGRDIGDANVLADVAASAGMDRDRVKAFLASGEGTDEVRLEIALGRRTGTQGVPTFVLNGHPLFSGAQPADVIAAAFREWAILNANTVTEAPNVQP
ncbi:MAG TPA: DsbA family oxidoreductase [Tepidisphaeraceae bacterium]|jgi:predicted DsbA family dithiol-disulfide isomerase